MSDQTPVDDSTPPSADTEQPSQEPTETVEALKERLAAEQKEKELALEEAKRWKNRVKEENPPEKKKDEDELYTDWRIDNKQRIGLVKDQYEAELSELQSMGAKLTVATREKALKLAEANAGVKSQAVSSTDEPIPSAGVDRGGEVTPTLTESDRIFGIKAETKKKYPMTW